MAFNPTNPLCSLQDLKSTLRITDDSDDDRLNLAIDAASRQIENKVGRRFWQDTTGTTGRTFIASTPFLADVDDFFLPAGQTPGAAITGVTLQTDPYGDGSFGLTWQNPTYNADGSVDGGDFQLEPLNGLSEGQPWPFERIRAVRSLLFPLYGGIAYPVPYTQALIKITAQWGWNYVPTEIRKACVLQSMALFKADDTPFGATPFSEVGIVRQKDDLHPTAKALVERYREVTVRVA